ncbi:cobalamin biosynthesis protein [Saccharopolyspora gloriosae]|uniref:cobalamin biosynthesis protein n=1 Tax=Saccharopolyspora gloriosae TaxID=455344 RepID=UPI001FB5CF99|nr:cobalamin biosynthesis protein [Saccharopolyspora gloriosae]
MIGLFPRSPQEQRTATELAARWGPDAMLVDGGPGPALRRLWSSLDVVVLFLPVGAAVRLIAPLLRDERTDPEVVCVDERFAVTVSGGAQAVAPQIAEVLGRVPVLTTGAAVSPLDELVDHLSATVDGDLAGCAQSVADEEHVRLVNPHGFPLPAMPENVSAHCDEPEWTVVVDDRRPVGELGERTVRLIPPTLVVGVGSVRGVSRTAVTGLMSRLDREHGLDPRAIRAFATAEAKADERGILDAVQDLGFWHSADGEELPLRLYPAAELAEVAVPNPSAEVLRETGTASVAEAAALRAAGELAVGESGAAPDSGGSATSDQDSSEAWKPLGHNDIVDELAVELVVPKLVADGVTVAAARVRPRGRVTVVGLGPGPADLRAPRAEAELRRAAAVIGSAHDLGQVRDLLHPGARTEAVDSAEAGARAAAEHARDGHVVALIGTGDAAPQHAAVRAEPGCRGLNIVVIPGIPAP